MSKFLHDAAADDDDAADDDARATRHFLQKQPS